MEAAEERQKAEDSVNGDDGLRSLEEFEKDPVAEVFGDDKRRSYCRAMSSTSNVKQVKLAQASKAIISYKENENQQWKMKMENSHDQMHEKINTMSSAIIDLKEYMKELVNQLGGNMVTQRVEVASNTEHTPSNHINFCAPSNDFNGSTTREKQSVMLLSRDLKDVAEGHIGVQKVCHGRRVVEGEKVVYVEKVIDPDAPLFEAPQNGLHTLSELVDGGFVIWPEYRLRY